MEKAKVIEALEDILTHDHKESHKKVFKLLTELKNEESDEAVYEKGNSGFSVTVEPDDISSDEMKELSDKFGKKKLNFNSFNENDFIEFNKDTFTDDVKERLKKARGKLNG